MEVLSISALDLFASALGVFILMAVLLFPYYLNQPSVAADLDGARRDIASGEATLTEARQFTDAAAERRAHAEARQQQALDAEAEAQRESDEAAEVLAAAQQRASKVDRNPATEPKRVASFSIPDLDLVFVMDATGSMRNEIADVQRSLLSITRVLERLAPSLNMGFVAFKDRGDEYVTNVFPLQTMNRSNLASLQAFVRRLQAKGGGDTPEPVGEAIARATEMPWRSGAMGRILVIGDAPAHVFEVDRALGLANGFRASASSDRLNRRLFAIFTGSNRPGRAFYQRLATAGGGDFINHRGRLMESVLLSILDSRRADRIPAHGTTPNDTRRPRA